MIENRIRNPLNPNRDYYRGENDGWYVSTGWAKSKRINIADTDDPDTKNFLAIMEKREQELGELTSELEDVLSLGGKKDE